MLSFLRHHDWEILVMDAHLEAPSDDGNQKTIIVNLTSSADRL